MNAPAIAFRSGRRPPHGFTLVELLVSMAIGLLIVLALITMLINVNRNNAEMSKTNRVIENGRFALQLLAADLSHAGYWGGVVPQFDDLTASAAPTDYPTAAPDPCLSYSAANWTAAHTSNLVGISVQAYEIPATIPSPTLTACVSKIPNAKASNDVLVVRHAEACVPGTGNCAAATAGELFMQVQRCGTTAPATPYTFSTDTFTVLQERNCVTAADKRRFVSNLYYVRNYAATVGDGVPTLMRSEYGLSSGTPQHKAPEALIEGIEAFRVELGVDTLSDSGAAVNFAAAIVWADPTNKNSPTNRGDGIPDGTYVHCTAAVPCTSDQLANTVAVKLYVLVRSEFQTPGYTDSKTYNLGSTSVGPFNDTFKRHLFSQTIRLSNVSSRRETP